MLRTNDAQYLYRQLGFGIAPDPERNMEELNARYPMFLTHCDKDSSDIICIISLE